MIYYPDEYAAGGWADGALACLCYNRMPSKLQCAIRKVFEHATSQIRIPGTEVLPFALHSVLDGKNTNDYVQRVEPSVIGGQKMAKALMDTILTGSTSGCSSGFGQSDVVYNAAGGGGEQQRMHRDDSGELTYGT